MASVRRFSAHELIVRAGEQASTVYLLRQGQVRTYLLGSDGRQSMTSVLGAGQLVGISGLLGYRATHEFAETLGRVEAWAMPADQVVRLLPVDRDLRGLVLGALAQRLAQGIALLADLTLHGVTDRLQNVERLLRAQLGERPQLSQRTLADLIGARPETLSRAMHHSRVIAGHGPLRGVRTSPSWSGDRTSPSWSGDRTSPPWPPSPPEERGEGISNHERPGTTSDSLERELAGLPVQTFGVGERLPIGALEDVAYVIQHGLVRLLLADAGGRQIIVDEAHSGHCLPLPAVGGLHLAGLCVEPLSPVSVWILSPADLVHLLDDHPHLCRRLLAQTAARLNRVELLLHRAHAPSARARVASVLFELALREGRPRSDGSYHIPSVWTHEALAHTVGMRRETVSRSLGALSADGHVRRNGQHLVICDPQRLALAFGLEALQTGL